MTTLERRLRQQEVEGVYAEAESDALSTVGVRFDYTDSIAFPSAWASKAQLRQIAASVGINAGEAEQFMLDPDAYLQSGAPHGGCSYSELPHVVFALDHAWQVYIHSKHQEAVRTAAIRLTFGDCQIAFQEAAARRGC